MNKTEAQYVDEVLRPRLCANEILGWKFECVKLKLAKRTFYTPDFLVLTPEQLEFHETKGFWEEDARVKIKVAATLYPWARFLAVQRKGGVWKGEDIEPAD
jgi:hypothetical protein